MYQRWAASVSVASSAQPAGVVMGLMNAWHTSLVVVSAVSRGPSSSTMCSSPSSEMPVVGPQNSAAVGRRWAPPAGASSAVAVLVAPLSWREMPAGTMDSPPPCVLSSLSSLLLLSLSPPPEPPPPPPP